jgi:hypothetical protein
MRSYIALTLYLAGLVSVVLPQAAAITKAANVFQSVADALAG